MLVDDLLAPGGAFARLMGASFEDRPEQVRLARAVSGVLCGGGHLAAEAPTGSGKSLAYLAAAAEAVQQTRPGGRRERTRLVIATATKALQDQLSGKDVPALQAALASISSPSMSTQVLKGMSNYLCTHKADIVTKSGGGSDARLAADLIKTFVQGGKWDGSMDSCPRPVPATLAGRLTTTADACRGDSCAFRHQCPALNARANAREADVVIANYAILFEDVRIFETTGKHGLLGPYQGLIVDEAHVAAGIARQHFGEEVSLWNIQKLGEDVSFQWRQPEAAGLLSAVRNSVGSIFDQLAKLADGRRVVRLPNSFGLPPSTELAESVAAVMSSLASMPPAKAINEPDAAYHDRLAELDVAARRLQSAALLVERLAAASPPEEVRFIEPMERGKVVGPSALKLASRPVWPGKRLKPFLLDAVRGSVWLSATLRQGEADGSASFSYFRRNVGLGKDSGEELVLESPFDLSSNVLFIIPSGAVSAKHSSFPDVASRLVREVVRLAQGRTLVLATSTAAVRRYGDALQGLPWPILVQGGGLGNAELATRFRSGVSSVLVGTRSFWEGLDVPGESLSCVVIDKPPFPTPDDPIAGYMQDCDLDWWNDYSLPEAVTLFRQAFGRLVRSKKDRGCVVLLDARIADPATRYKARFFAPFKEVPRRRNIEMIPPFLAGRSLVDIEREINLRAASAARP